MIETMERKETKKTEDVTKSPPLSLRLDGAPNEITHLLGDRL
jgi:hypothetical protein